LREHWQGHFCENEGFFFRTLFVAWIKGKNHIEGKQSFLKLLNAKINGSPYPH
jgi:hypothetical protein